MKFGLLQVPYFRFQYMQSSDAFVLCCLRFFSPLDLYDPKSLKSLKYFSLMGAWAMYSCCEVSYV